MFERLAEHPYSYMAKDFIMLYRRELVVQNKRLLIAEPKIGEDGRQYVTTYGEFIDGELVVFGSSEVKK